MSQKGKFCKPKRKKRCPLILLVLAVVVIGVLAVMFAMKEHRSADIYSRICADGYTGTAEQWIASLVGEVAGDDQTPTAYELACQQGYDGSTAQWIKTITDIEAENSDTAVFPLVQAQGYTGSMAEWLAGLVENPDELGVSEDDLVPTEYELACQFGYQGTFIEWVVSMAQDKVF